MVENYKTLGLSTNATWSAVRSRYIELVKKVHPDKNGEKDQVYFYTT